MNFAVSGIYSLLILTLTFNFLLAMRLRQLQNRFASYSETVDKKIGILTERLEIISPRPSKASTEKGSDDKPRA